jgi:hypothetical protein
MAAACWFRLVAAHSLLPAMQFIAAVACCMLCGARIAPMLLVLLGLLPVIP